MIETKGLSPMFRLFLSLDQRVVVGGKNEGKQVMGTPPQVLILATRSFAREPYQIKMMEYRNRLFSYNGTTGYNMNLRINFFAALVVRKVCYILVTH